jgi:cytochrome c biogenesis protein CcmG/thiol:disulfide interchange protein DsbE
MSTAGEIATPTPVPPPRGRRPRHLIRWIGGIVAVALVVVAIVLATRPSSQASQVESPLIGRAAPSLTGTTLEGGHFSLAGERGRYVFVNFFASWCPPCQQEAPALEQFAFAQQRSATGADLVSVVFQDSDDAARQFVATVGATWPAVADPGGAIANDFGVESPPTTFLVNPAGTVVGDLVGPVTAGQLQAMLAQARKAAVDGG